jgi:glycosyltransferase involved in cell wall biosynthesis
MGNGELLEDAKALVKKLDIEDMVYGLVRQDMPHVLNAIHILHPTFMGGLPIGLLEAMAMAKPCCHWSR